MSTHLFLLERRKARRPGFPVRTPQPFLKWSTT